MAASAFMYECVCEWVNMTSVVKDFERSVDWKTLYNPFHLAFHGYIQTLTLLGQVSENIIVWVNITLLM